MNLLDKLERKFGRYAVKGLMLHIVGLNLFVYLLSWIRPEFVKFLVLEPSLVLKGEVWRLVSYIFIPPGGSPIFILFILYFYYMIGTGLEHEWGSFRFNIYYLVGMIGTTAAAFIANSAATSMYLNLSLFLAFAYIYPNYELHLFLILPIKIKYLAWLNWAFIGYTILLAPVSLSYKLAAVVSILNYFLFFGKDIVLRYKTRGHSAFRKGIYRYNLKEKPFMHKCTVCGITEKDNPQMDFRYCSTCEGDYEYCMDHLKNHEHIKAN